MIKTEHAGAKNGGGYWGRRAEAKRRCKVLRRSRDRAEVAAQRDSMCDCPACRGGYERDCWASVDVPELDRPRACVLRIVNLRTYVVQHSPDCTCVPCSNCRGDGYTDAPELCSVCRGVGYVPGETFWEDG